MTLADSAHSLRDWITDQLNEIRHATPLAVLASTPVSVPQLADMPTTATHAVCEWQHIDNRHCHQPATLRVTLHACHNSRPLYLLCDHHTVRLIGTWTAWFARCSHLVCADCGTPFRHIPDVIKAVRPL